MATAFEMLDQTSRALVFFDKSDFTTPDFNIKHFISNRLHVPLDLLIKELGGYLKDIRTQLVDLVNSEYSHFVSLTKNLIGVDVMIAELKSPLSNCREKIAEMLSVFDRLVAQLETQFEYRNSLRQRKSWMQMVKDVASSVEKLESLLNIDSSLHSRRSSGSATDRLAELKLDSFDERYLEKLVERIGIEYNQLNFLLSRIGPVPFVDAVRPRISRVRESMHSFLSVSFGRALEEASDDSLPENIRKSKLDTVSRYFQSYLVMDQSADAILVFQLKLAKPFVDELLSPQKLLQIKNYTQRRLSGSSYQELSGERLSLSQVYASFIEYIKGPKLWPVVHQMRALIKAGADLDPIIDVALPLLVAKLSPIIQPMFVPTSPDAFHEAYTETTNFLQRMEAETLSSSALVSKFRSSQAYTELLRRWQTLLYWQIRYNEIALQFDDVLDTPLPDMIKTLSKNAQGLLLPASQQLMVCLRVCWSDKVHLHVLSGRIWRLSLLLVARYREWVRSLVENLSMADAKENEMVATLLDAGAYLLNDASVLPAKLEIAFRQYIAPKLPKAVQQEPRMLLESLKEQSVLLLESDLKPLKEHMLQQLAQDCSVILRSVKDIPGQYRRTNREPPKLPSSFLAACFKPLEQFREQHESLLQEAYSLDWSSEVVEAVAQSYYKLLDEMLTTVQKTEDSLKRLRKAKRPTISSSTALTPTSAVRSDLNDSITDEDKIRMQCYIDVKEFLNLALKFGAALKDGQTLQRLSHLVQPFESLLYKPE